MNDATVSSADAGTEGEQDEPVPPSPVGFELLDEVGRGGMGVVYRANDLALGREVAVKILQARFRPDSSTAVRFVEEARITAQLQHPGVPAVYQVGKLDDSRPYLAMKLIRGETLDVLLKGKDSLDVSAVFEAICQAVGYAHAHGIIHRDLKPANIMVGAFGEVQVMDWGLSKVLASGPRQPPESQSDPEATTAHEENHIKVDSDGNLTQAGSVLGTPAYMAPEQAAGEIEKIDARSDVFGLGAILCAMLTGKPPFEGENAESVRVNAMRGKTEAAFARLDQSAADPDLITLCKRCLAFEPSARPSNANEVAVSVATLRRAADDRAKQAERKTLAEEVRRKAIQKGAVVAATVLLLGIAGTTTGLLWANNARHDAEEARGKETEALKTATKNWNEAVEREEEAVAVLNFLGQRVFAAAKPKGQDGGMGKDITLRDALVTSIPILSKEFAAQPRAEAYLRETLASTLWALGEYPEAAAQWELAYARYAARNGENSREALRCASSAGWVYRHLGKINESLQRLESVLKKQTAALPENDPDVLITKERLGAVYRRVFRNAESIKLLQETVDVRTKQAGKEDQRTLSAIDNLANSLVEAGRAKEAVKLYEQTLAVRKRILPKHHPDIYTSMSDLAAGYEGSGKSFEGMLLHEAVLAGRKEALPKDHPATIEAMKRLAPCYIQMGRINDAFKMYEDALAARKRSLPREHPETLGDLDGLSNIYFMLGRYPEALVHLQEALAIRKSTMPEDRWETYENMYRVASALDKLDRTKEAIPLIDDCLAHANLKNTPTTLIPKLYIFRMSYFRKARDEYECRRIAENWERLGRTDATSLYNAACWRAIVAEQFAKSNKPVDAKVEAEKAMAWLQKAVAAGFGDPTNLKNDSDLDALRGRVDFKKLVELLEKKGSKK